ncbi:hypothetical protein [Nocardia sp. NPDC051832]|uniref:hypothetical protein n=1 Tax=Nocardia sp. NPDC051832 TaxID=3155673 RepID=UPI0034245724
MFRSKRSAAAAATTFGAMAAALVLTAPTAPALVSSINVSQGLSFGSSTVYGTGCSYTVTATASNGEAVLFWDFNGGVFDPPGVIWVGSSGTAVAQWTPLTKGTHTLIAWGAFNDRQTQITVGTGFKLGNVCLVTS